MLIGAVGVRGAVAMPRAIVIHALLPVVTLTLPHPNRARRIGQRDGGDRYDCG